MSAPVFSHLTPEGSGSGGGSGGGAVSAGLVFDVTDSRIGLVGVDIETGGTPPNEDTGFANMGALARLYPEATFRFRRRRYGFTDPTFLRGARAWDVRGGFCQWQNVNTVHVFDVDVAGPNTNPGMHWDSTSDPRTPGTIHNGYLINTAAAWSFTVTCSTPAQAANFAPGDWAYVSSRCIESGGYPPNALYRDWSRVRSVNASTGVITLWWPIQNTHRSDQYDYTDGTYYVGKARIRKLNRGAGFTVCESLYIENVTLLDNPTFPSDAINGGWGQMYLTGCIRAHLRNMDIGNFVISETKESVIEDCRSFTMELDKACGTVDFVRGEHAVLAGGSGFDNVRVWGTTARDYIATDAEMGLAIGCKVSGSNNGGSMLSLGTQHTRLFANAYVRRAGLDGTTFSSPPPIVSLPAVVAATATTATYSRNLGDFWDGIKGLRPGVLVYVGTPSGKRGVVTDLYFDGTNEVIEVADGWIGGAPSGGDVLKFSQSVSWYAPGEIDRTGNPARKKESSIVAFRERIQEFQDSATCPRIVEDIYAIPNDVAAHLFSVEGAWRELEVGVLTAQAGKALAVGLPVNAAPAWVTGTTYAANSVTSAGGHNYYSALGGIAGATAPTGTAFFTPVSDGGVTDWIYCGTIGAEQAISFDCGLVHVAKIGIEGATGFAVSDTFGGMPAPYAFVGGTGNFKTTGPRYYSMGGTPTAVQGYMRTAYMPVVF